MTENTFMWNKTKAIIKIIMFYFPHYLTWKAMLALIAAVVSENLMFLKTSCVEVKIADHLFNLRETTKYLKTISYGLKHCTNYSYTLYLEIVTLSLTHNFARRLFCFCFIKLNRLLHS